MTFELRKNIIMSTLPLAQSFRYKDDFQILPPPKEAKLPPAILNDYPCVLELTFENPIEKKLGLSGETLPQWVVENEEAGKRRKEVLLVMTVITDNRFFQYSSRQAWYVSLGDKSKKQSGSEWGQEMYSCPELDLEGDIFTESTELDIPLVPPNDYFNRYGRHMDKTLDLPKNIYELLDGYYSLDQDAKKVFLSACSLFDQGLNLWSEHPSLSFTSMVSALEALIHYDHRDNTKETCKECGQDRYRVIKKFKDFFSEYGSPSEEFKKYALKIYKYRSKIVHRGELFLGEVEPLGHSNWDDLGNRDMRRNIITTCRICMVNWLWKQSQT